MLECLGEGVLRVNLGLPVISNRSFNLNWLKAKNKEREREGSKEWEGGGKRERRRRRRRRKGKKEKKNVGTQKRKVCGFRFNRIQGLKENPGHLSPSVCCFPRWLHSLDCSQPSWMESFFFPTESPLSWNRASLSWLGLHVHPRVCHQGRGRTPPGLDHSSSFGAWSLGVRHGLGWEWGTAPLELDGGGGEKGWPKPKVVAVMRLREDRCWMDKPHHYPPLDRRSCGELEAFGWVLQDE